VSPDPNAIERQPGTTARTEAPRGWLPALLMLAPLVLLFPLVFIDLGLFLVMVLPIGCATLLAAGWDSIGRSVVVPTLVFLGLLAILSTKVLFPAVGAIRDADSHAGKAIAYDGLSRILGFRPPWIAEPLARVAARGVATKDRKMAEELLIAARPGSSRDLLIPSIEQIWGASAYAAAGVWGNGLGRAIVGGRGVAEAVSYAENTFSVYVLAEHGAAGGLIILSLYLLLTGSVTFASVRSTQDPVASYRASRALLLVATLMLVIPAVYVALSNLGVVPITGQNMPFLGLNSWSDVTLCAGTIGIMISGAVRTVE
jgi:cell division protein FtsW (lipid II flippase)